MELFGGKSQNKEKAKKRNQKFARNAFHGVVLATMLTRPPGELSGVNNAMRNLDGPKIGHQNESIESASSNDPPEEKEE